MKEQVLGETERSLTEARLKKEHFTRQRMVSLGKTCVKGYKAGVYGFYWLGKASSYVIVAQH
ncbi:hypothetical protein [Rickettsiella massiliensis]|uniref:hypothetical protein n=1 Tax=Rickettsiella massiliensis TaxID=676517 RepID=UPI00029ACE69|nr:hypothetical protein [Rickettsiella massiliensis]